VKKSGHLGRKGWRQKETGKEKKKKRKQVRDINQNKNKGITKGGTWISGTQILSRMAKGRDNERGRWEED
jgi:hypothetical protein